jgi:hypothetical protein
VSFLSQLKAQANAKQAAMSVEQTDLLQRLEQTEAACKITWNYLSDMVRQLDVLAPDGPAFSADGKTPWPPMQLRDFRVDARKKTLRTREVYSSIGIGWDITPRLGKPLKQLISVNFMPELQRVESRLSAGGIPNERRQIRHPEKQSVQAISFEYLTQAHGSISVSPNHEDATLEFRFCNVSGLGVHTGVWPATVIQTPFLDELARLVMSQPSRLSPAPD